MLRRRRMNVATGRVACPTQHVKQSRDAPLLTGKPRVAIMRTMTLPDLPATPGTYVLLLKANAPIVLDMPRFGQVALPASQYAYVGSAHGPGGLRARVGRHLRAEKPLHWHIDYLTAALPIVDVVAAAGIARLECIWVKRLIALDGTSVPVPGFGSSDCRNGCPAHLVRLSDDLKSTQLEEILSVEYGSGISGQPATARRPCPGFPRRHQRRRRRGGRACGTSLRGPASPAAGAPSTPGRRRPRSALVGSARLGRDRRR